MMVGRCDLHQCELASAERPGSTASHLVLEGVYVS